MSRPPRVIVEVPWGKLASRRAFIEPGASLSVGRSEPAGLVVGHDRQMSGLHFELTWDGARCRFRDLGSAKGTLLDGQPAREGEIAHGGWLRAGDTVFMVFIEGTDPGPDVALTANAPPELAARKAHALEVLTSTSEPLYTLLDAARTPRIRELLRAAAVPSRSLYQGAAGEALAEVAPYLVALPRGEALLGRLVREGWGQSWGVYLTSQRPFDEVRSHFRRLLLVKSEGRYGEDGREKDLYFRFYDPRVLRDFLPLREGRQEAEMFGEVLSFLLEGEAGEVLRFGPGQATPTTM